MQPETRKQAKPNCLMPTKYQLMQELKKQQQDPNQINSQLPPQQLPSLQKFNNRSEFTGQPRNFAVNQVQQDPLQ